ncbi:hypothetical protein CONCODRAFT_10166 [Conidiobolus coronatus NRRL 28638]|uniref:F-box domain-containing protein n=1 Tax=Conidiobolus coronatus (strain ATCC 28846 / CBS 209.66 / NRRL 28638) TaxID=796925 RepID=A0A137NY44_CONC2|nr:hypothetical protein CONCODRAFT_10166 [Conidiobolus coronatus NRRL 28638]|eukprot:KXN67715.1 hypothetical protein CONCODRAFT_10166 [Conidiobolus coronatus NRRL 28638]
MNSNSIDDDININRNASIDWELILIDSPIFQYISKYELLDLSFISKRIRLKVSPYLFSKLRIKPKVLYTQPNFFQHRNNFDLDRLTYWERFILLGTYFFDKNLAFRETQIDPFINQSATTLSKIGQYCNVLIFDQLKKASYFLIPITVEFLNLTELFIFKCELPLYKFNIILSKLVKLEILHLDTIYFIKSIEDSELKNDINFPQNLEVLSYEYIYLVVTDLPQFHTIEFAYNLMGTYESIVLELPLKSFPKLKVLNYGKAEESLSLIKFLDINPQLKALCLNVAILRPAILSILTSMPNLEGLKIETNGTSFEEFEIHSLSNLQKLQVLNLNIITGSDFRLITQFIKFTPNLTRLTIETSANAQFESFDKMVESLKYFNNSTATKSKLNFITKTYLK